MSQVFMVKCVGCKCDMVQSRGNHKKCAECKMKKKKECTQVYLDSIKKEHIKYRRICLNCGDKFYSKTITGMICSNRCRNYYNNMRRQIKVWELKVKLLQMKIDQNKEVIGDIEEGKNVR